MNSKAQAWYMDFAIALLLFTFTLVVYFSYTNNFQKEEKGELDNLLKDANAIASSLVLSGYPTDWKNETVVRIGIADEQKLNATKVKNFKGMDYNRTRKIFATPYTYFVFFVNEKGEVLNINSVCGVGYPLINLTYEIKSAYYYSSESDKFLKDFMNQTFKADIYFGDDGNNQNDIDGLMTNISKYGFIMFEHPDISPSGFNNFKALIENFSANGGLLMLSGQLTSAQGRNLAGSDFYKKSGQSLSDRNSTAINTDQFLSFTIGENIVFRQAYYVNSTPNAVDFKQIATFNADNGNALSRWAYGNGTVYFFSDFDTSYFNGNFVGVVEEATKGFIQGTCTAVNVTGINKQKFVKAERYLSYNSNVVKMEVYLWQ